MKDHLPLYLYLALGPERRIAPTDGADVLESLDDTYRLAERFNQLLRDSRGIERLLYSRDPLTADEFVRSLFLGHGDSPLTVTAFRFGSPGRVGKSGVTAREEHWNKIRR